MLLLSLFHFNMKGLILPIFANFGLHEQLLLHEQLEETQCNSKLNFFISDAVTYHSLIICREKLSHRIHT